MRYRSHPIVAAVVGFVAVVSGTAVIVYSAQPMTGAAPATPLFETTQAGDTWNNVATRRGVNVDDLQAFNNVQRSTSNSASPGVVGRVLFVPSGGTPPPSTTTSTTAPTTTSTTSTTTPSTTSTTSSTVAPTTTAPPATTTTTVPPTLPPSATFLIGVDLQPAALHDDWAARGVNTLVRVDHDLASTDAQISAWETSAAANGLRTIRQPKSDPALDIGNDTLLAWAPHADEPERTSPSQTPWETVQATYATLHAADPNRPVFIGVQGTFNQFDIRKPAADPYEPNWAGEHWYRKYFAGADWLTVHRYPVNNGSSWFCDVNATMSCLNGMAHRVRTWQEPENVKPWLAYIEASDYDTTDTNPGPTPAQLAAQVWYVVTEGARGVLYFPERVAPTFASDATTPAVRAEMTTLNARLTALAPILQGPVDPAGTAVSAPVPLEVGWRATATHLYAIVVNPTATARNGQNVTVTGASGVAEVLDESRTETVSGGVITDDFAPYGVHIYKVEIS